MLSISIRDHTNLPLIHKKIIKAAEKGVGAATQEAVEWIKEDVIRGEGYVGHQYYPDVTDATKRSKAKRGKTIVLVDTTNFLSSWNGEANGLEGKITGGGGKDYHAKLLKIWQIDKLFFEVHAKESEKIIKASIDKAV
jgi:hypothetical protein